MIKILSDQVKLIHEYQILSLSVCNLGSVKKTVKTDFFITVNFQ